MIKIEEVGSADVCGDKSDEVALAYLAKDFYGKQFEDLTEEQQIDLREEMEYRDSLGWRS